MNMLRSINQEQEEEEASSTADPHSSVQLRQLLISCAEVVSRSDFSAADRLISILSAHSSPYGDSTERLIHQFITALSLRLSNHQHNITNNNYSSTALQGCYLSLNQITPFIRFSHLTANQAILESIQVGQQSIHILDLDIMHGVQWPPLMQALAERAANTLQPPPMLRITATGHDLDLLHRTGHRLLTFAQSLGLRFQFNPLLHDDPTSIPLLPNEPLAVNCVFYLHRLANSDLRLFLHKIKSLNPRVVTIAEREANHNHPIFMSRFVEALDHYSAVYESLEATLPPKSKDRLAVEQIWFGREIMDIVGAEGERRRERHQRLETWEMMLRSSGFVNVALSPFAFSQAKLLLRLHYPSEGYQIQILNNSSFCLCWQNRPLFTVSSWR